MQLEKAIIAELDGDNEKDPFSVQFNPTTLRLAISNRVEGGQSQGKEVRQYLGASSTTLSLDLIFDTADEGSTESPRSVREKTKQIERFMVVKQGANGESTPPRIRFTWGDLIVEGIVDSLTIDFEHFAANGVPLRAKVPLSIQGQDRAKELKAGDGRKNAPAPGGLGLGASFGLGLSAGIGFSASVGVGIGASASVGVALGGESAGEFAARVGVDPAAWRGLQIGGESSLSLSAGVEVGFDANLSASAGLGVTVGVEAGSSSSLEASFGLDSSNSITTTTGVGAQLASGFALSSAGGVGAAIESVQATKNQVAEDQARTAFKAPAKALPAASPQTGRTLLTSASTSPSTQPQRPEQLRTPLTRTGLPSPGAQQASPPAPRPPRADPRSSSFGFGVPLRATVGAAADRRSESIQGDVALKPRVDTGAPPITSDPTKPAWVALPARDLGRTAADKSQGKLRPLQPCGCSGGCGH